MAKEKKELKALQVAEEKEYQRKLQEKVDRDNEEFAVATIKKEE